MAVKTKRGTKRTCPDCGTRFYDLGRDTPVVCLACKHQWVPEPVLKSRQPQAEEIKTVKKPEIAPGKEGDDTIIADEELEIEEEEGATPVEEVELEDADEDVSGVIQDPKASE